LRQAWVKFSSSELLKTLIFSEIVAPFHGAGQNGEQRATTKTRWTFFLLGAGWLVLASHQ